MLLLAGLLYITYYKSCFVFFVCVWFCCCYFLFYSPEKLMDLRNEYLEADEATKRFLEQRYGKRVIQKALEEMESKEWLEKNSKSCPCCGTHIEVSIEGKS